MGILRKNKQSNFTTIDNHALKNKELSFKAKGMLVYMWSLPNDWIFYETEIVNHATDGISSVRGALKELQDAGYLLKQRKRDEKGKLKENDWLISDIPMFSPDLDYPNLEKPNLEKPNLENHTLLNTNTTKDLSKLNTDNTNNHSDKPNDNELKQRFEDLWNQYPNKKGKPKAFTAYKQAIKAGTTDDEIAKGIENYKREIKIKRTDKQYIAHGSTWFSQKRWLDEYDLVGGGTEWDRNAPVDEELGF